MKLLNESRPDRGVRMLAGALLVAAGWPLASGALGVSLIAVGAMLLGTGITGWCPAYTALGASTRQIPAGHCPMCDAGQRPRGR
jgi:hypothetical protein